MHESLIKSHVWTIRQHFPGDIPGQLPKRPEPWPHAYGAQVGDTFQQLAPGWHACHTCQQLAPGWHWNLFRDMGGWPMLWKNLKPALFILLWEMKTQKLILSSRLQTLLGRWVNHLIFFIKPFLGVQPVWWGQCVLWSRASLSSSLQSLLQPTVPNASHPGSEHLVRGRISHD